MSGPNIKLDLLLYFLFFNIFLLLFKYSFLPFPHPPHLPPLLPPPHIIVHVSFLVVPENPSPFSHIIPSNLPSGYSQIVHYFNISAIFCLLVCFVD